MSNEHDTTGGVPDWFRWVVGTIAAAITAGVTTTYALTNTFATKAELAKSTSVACVPMEQFNEHVRLSGHPGTALELAKINAKLTGIETNIEWIRATLHEDMTTTHKR